MPSPATFNMIAHNLRQTADLVDKLATSADKDRHRATEALGNVLASLASACTFTVHFCEMECADVSPPVRIVPKGAN